MTCTLCNSGQIGDEFHIILECKSLDNILRKNHLCKYYYQNPNIIKFKELMSTNKKKMSENLCFFIVKIYDTVLYPLSTLLSLLMYTCIIKHPYLFI